MYGEHLRTPSFTISVATLRGRISLPVSLNLAVTVEQQNSLLGAIRGRTCEYWQARVGCVV